MENFGLLQLAKELDDIEETGVSFTGQSNSWGTEEEVQAVVDEINKCEKLIYLNLEGNTLGVNAANSIGKSLEKHPEFKKALWKDLFTGRLKTEIPQALKIMGEGIIAAAANLTVLDCSDNALGPNGMTGLVDLLSSTACYSLQELKLNNCGLGSTGGKMLSKALLTCHSNSCSAGSPLSLKVFIAGRNRLENDGAKAMAKVFFTVKTLEEVAMPQNGIYHAGVSALSDAFKDNKNMKILNLNDNTIGPKGAASLAEAFSSMQKLKEINFGDCLLKTDGALFLADALQDTHNDLEIINMEFNEIGPEAGIAIVTAVNNKPNIKAIELGGNHLGFECRERINEIMIESDCGVTVNLSEDESETEVQSGDEDNDDASTTDSNNSDQKNDDETEDDVIVVPNQNESLNSTVEGSFTSENSILYAGEEERPNTIETFCNTPNPSMKMFKSLEETNKIEAFRAYLKESTGDEYLIKLVFTVLKCSELADESTEALDLALALYKDAFDYAIETNQITRVRTFFLIQLGLLKCEDKTFKPTYKLKSCRYTMRKAIDNNLMPSDIKTTFDLFLEKFA